MKNPMLTLTEVKAAIKQLLSQNETTEDNILLSIEFTKAEWDIINAALDYSTEEWWDKLKDKG